MPTAIRPKDLPDFVSPPLHQVGLAIMFEELSGLKSFHMGMLSQLYPNLPIIEAQAAVPATFETFGSSQLSTGRQQKMRVEFLNEPPLMRHVFSNEARNSYLQIQADRVVRNWVRQGSGAYPRYESLRESLEQDFLQLENFAAEKQLGQLKPNQCEAAYVNYIDLPEGKKSTEALAEIFCFWSNSFKEPLGIPIERNEIKFSQVLEIGGKPFARLITHVLPAYNSVEKKEAFQLTLTVRGRPEKRDLQSSLEFLDVARSCIVKCFDGLTRVTMHTAWGKK